MFHTLVWPDHTAREMLKFILGPSILKANVSIVKNDDSISASLNIYREKQFELNGRLIFVMAKSGSFQPCRFVLPVVL